MIDEGILVRILSSRGITVRDLRLRYTPARKINLKVTLTYSLGLIERIGYEARDPIEFEGGKGLSGSDLFLDLLFSPFY